MDAQKEVEYSRVYGGHGADTDIIVASAKAYLAALNKLIVAQTEGAQPAHTNVGVMLVG
jgi:2-isopropylmalate synthase